MPRITRTLRCSHANIPTPETPSTTKSSRDHAGNRLSHRPGNTKKHLRRPCSHVFTHDRSIPFSDVSKVKHEKGFSSLLSCIPLEYNFSSILSESFPSRSISDRSRTVLHYDFNLSNNEIDTFIISECPSCQFGVSPRLALVQFPLFRVYRVKLYNQSLESQLT